MKNRLFVALNLPEEVIEQIISLRNKISKSLNIKWEPNKKLHLTIKFIGDVSNEMMNQIADELSFITNYTSIKCSVSKFGFFYRDSRPIILWAGLIVCDHLNKIIIQINLNLNNLSIPIEQRKFNPHITLLRIKNKPEINFVNNFKNYTFKPILFNANSITLYKSILHPEESEYIKIKNYKLKELE